MGVTSSQTDSQFVVFEGPLALAPHNSTCSTTFTCGCLLSIPVCVCVSCAFRFSHVGSEGRPSVHEKALASPISLCRTQCPGRDVLCLVRTPCSSTALVVTLKCVLYVYVYVRRCLLVPPSPLNKTPRGQVFFPLCAELAPHGSWTCNPAPHAFLLVDLEN